MTQGDLFDVCANKHGGVETSVEANLKPDKVGDRHFIHQLILEAGSNGLTLKEACSKMGRTPNQISGRFTEIKARGMIRREGRRDGCFIWRAF